MSSGRASGENCFRTSEVPLGARDIKRLYALRTDGHGLKRVRTHVNAVPRPANSASGIPEPRRALFPWECSFIHGNAN